MNVYYVVYDYVTREIVRTGMCQEADVSGQTSGTQRLIAGPGPATSVAEANIEPLREFLMGQTASPEAAATIASAATLADMHEAYLAADA